METTQAVVSAEPHPTPQHTIRETIHESAALDRPFLVMNALAAVVASYGLLQDSAAVVIGAMIIAMLLGPITGIALAVVEGDRALLSRALAAEMAGVLLVLVIGYVIGRIHHSMPLGNEVLSRTAPNILDLVIALAAGAAGAYATVSRRISAGIVGVAIATALVPPLCACAICVSHHLYKAGAGAFLLFLTNLVAIQCATSLVLWAHGFRSHSKLRGWALARRFAPSGVMLGGPAVFLGYGFQQALARESLRAKAERSLRKEIERTGAAHLADLRIQPDDKKMLVIAVVRAPWLIVPASCARLEKAVRKATGRRDVDVRIRTIITRETDSHHYLWTDLPQENAFP